MGQGSILTKLCLPHWSKGDNGIAKSIAKWNMSNFTPSSFEHFVEKTHSSSIQSKEDD